MINTHLKPPGHSEATASLRELIEHCAEVLPAQGPITAFVHHNTLHALEHLPFADAVKQGARVFGCHAYLPEQKYRQWLESGRITAEDLREVVLENLGERADGLIGRWGSRYHLRMAMLQHPLRLAADAELRWLMAETEALERFREEVPAAERQRVIDDTRHWVMRDLRNGDGTVADDWLRERVAALAQQYGPRQLDQGENRVWEPLTLQLLWSICRHEVSGGAKPVTPSEPHVRHRELLLEATGEDCDLLTNEILIRQCAAFLDQGFAHWPMPAREQGFFVAVLSLYSQGGAPPDRWLRGLKEEARRLLAEGTAPMESIAQSLCLLGVQHSEREPFLTESLLALRGWAGMIWQLERRGDRVVRPAPTDSLIEFLAIRLILDRLAIAHVARRALSFSGSLADVRREAQAHGSRAPLTSVSQRAFLLFQMAQDMGWKPRDLYAQSTAEWAQLAGELDEFSGLERRRVFHLAFERNYLHRLLDAVGCHAKRNTRRSDPPRFQVACCIDDREESLRRHLEEVEPACETFGFPGFFAVAMYYRGLAEAYYQPLCPVVIKPSHYVREEVAYTFEMSHRRRAETRRAWGSASHHWHLGSRTFLGGMATALLGALTSVPLVGRILFPRTTARVRSMLGSLMRPPVITQLQLERSEAIPGPEPGHIGYSVAEMASILRRVLEDMGLTERYARLVIIIGHGSSSMNNPHESAYNCGACSGARGGPNARAFAQMANDLRVRSLLQQQGWQIPGTTLFVGAYHNTCNDGLTYFDLDRLPSSHWSDFEHAKTCLDRARQRNAHERCRRFESASLSLTPEEALRHVEGRAEDLSQARPEYNHATNAVTIVGRRSRTRGLFLDRRAFLTSYDPTIDDEEHTILGRVLQAAVPVCAGIALEYYFSTVDPDGWGCGSKLPHNVTSLLGVMTGAASDLRPGLSSQMVEIHEPLRPIFIIETTPEAMRQIIERDETVRRLCTNEWIYLVTLSPESSDLHVYCRGRFEPYWPGTAELPVRNSSAAWYRGWRDHLGFASIELPTDAGAAMTANRAKGNSK